VRLCCCYAKIACHAKIAERAATAAKEIIRLFAVGINDSNWQVEAEPALEAKTMNAGC
jgi:hypothetical protein